MVRANVAQLRQENEWSSKQLFEVQTHEARLTPALEVAHSALEAIKSELADLRAQEETSLAEHQRTFLLSQEFFYLLAQRLRRMMEYGFRGAIRQFARAKVITRESDLSFLDLRQVWDELPADVRSDAGDGAGPSQFHTEALEQRARIASSSSSADGEGQD